MVYAIVRAGGRQEKVSVGDFVTLNRVAGGAGSTIELPALLLVDGDKVTSAAADLAKVTVTAEILQDLRGPKIVIQKYKNKTGYKKRQGHRQELTRSRSPASSNHRLLFRFSNRFPRISKAGISDGT